jgi:xylan 1,4-beta-xylosidase
MRTITTIVIGIALNVLAGVSAAWTPDNGDGTFSNPLFYEEFSDPDIIRVENDYYLTGTTNHAMPGLPILHSTDLVNWKFLCYAFDRLNLGPESRLEDGKDFYGQGIWAPCFRYHEGVYYIFTNINNYGTQVFRASNPSGPWTRTKMNCSLHDLSVLFDDDGKVLVVWGYDEIHFAQLNGELTDIIPGTERVLIQRGAGMGEGCHFYKIRNSYYITSAWYAGRMRMPCARSDKPEGPYEINHAISMDESFGLAEGYRLQGRITYPYQVIPPNTVDNGRMSLHQGGIVETQSGQWWGFSMMDFNSLGRLTALSPVTWQDGWPYFGLPGNLKRTPRTWTKPDTGRNTETCTPYERNDDFSAATLKPIWQWNHVPDDKKWSLTERPGFLRLHSLPAKDLLAARNTLTQRAIGPVSAPIIKLETNGMKIGDIAGLALLNAPYAWIGISRQTDGLWLDHYDQLTGHASRISCKAGPVWLKADCNYLTEKATFSYSFDGKRFTLMGDEFTMIFQLRTFQGIRYSLFHYNTQGIAGGFADFDSILVEEPYPHGLMRPIPFGQTITLSAHGSNRILIDKDGELSASEATDPIGPASYISIVDRGLGRVALKSPHGFISVRTPENRVCILNTSELTDAETFQWMENVYGDIILLSLATHRYLRLDPVSQSVTADHPGPLPNRNDGCCLSWTEVGASPTATDGTL